MDFSKGNCYFAHEDWSFDTGRVSEDGDKVIDEAVYITLEDSRGAIYAYRHWEAYRSEGYRRDIDAEARALISRFEARFKAGEVPSEDHWTFIRYSYCSPYRDEAVEARLERQEDMFND